MTRAYELMVQGAVIETEDRTSIAGQDVEWLEKTEDELCAMHPLSLQLWLQNIQRVKRWYQSTNATREQMVLIPD